MRVRCISLFCVSLAVAWCTLAQNNPPGDQLHFPSRYVPSGEQMYKQFCAACHGDNAKGHGPAASSLKVKPPDLTTLAQRHHGKFPYAYVSSILLFGPGVAAHGSRTMPTWGAVFQNLDENGGKT